MVLALSITAFVAFTLGTLTGFVAMAIMVAASRDDEKFYRDDKDIDFAIRQLNDYANDENNASE
jgi:hypothetical protein